MTKEYIKIEDLVVGAVYEVASPAFNVGIWTGEAFLGPVTVDGRWETVAAKHYSLGYPEGTVTTISRIGSLEARQPFLNWNVVVALQALSEIIESTEV